MRPAAASRSRTRDAGRPGELLPSRPVTVRAMSMLVSTASSVASTAASKNGSSAAPVTGRTLGGQVFSERRRVVIAHPRVVVDVPLPVHLADRRDALRARSLHFHAATSMDIGRRL